ncbi:MAG: hypothetical protein PHS93_09090 [Candidatus Omnitrophica bacterium]|nr:hypothetical protein [Candidatus Omnitrophota bacterium]MDD5551292.1 hypothetical protein [Candidatus Omnitrophota bacterium]
MKVNFNQPLKNLDGSPIKDGDKAITLKDVCANALLAVEEKADGKVKLENWTLAQLVYKGGELDLTAEQVVKIKDMVAKSYTTLVVGQVLEILK